jgi:hypothetical protein
MVIKEHKNYNSIKSTYFRHNVTQIIKKLIYTNSLSILAAPKYWCKTFGK